MTLGVPYPVCAGSAAGGSNSLHVTAGTGITGARGVPAGSAIAVAVSGNSSSGLPAAVTDSQGNTYVQVILDTTRNPSLGLWAAYNAAPLVAGTGWITASFSGTSGAKELIAAACAGVMTGNAADADVIADAGSGTSPSSGSSGLLQQGSEWAVAALASGAAGGIPSSWTGGFTAIATAGAGPYLTLAGQVVSSPAALTAGATITSAAWTCGLVTFMAAVPPPPLIQPPLSAAVSRCAWW